MWLINHLLQLLQFAQANLYWLGLFNVSLMFAFYAEKDSFMKKFFSILFVISILPAAAYFLILSIVGSYDIDASPAKIQAWYWLASATLSWVLTLLYLRYGVQLLEVSKKKITRTTRLERNKNTDVREIHQHIPEQAQDFDVLKYLDQKKGVFLGLDESMQPTYLGFGTGISAPHVQVIGTTGAGKGVSLGVMATQFLELGEAVFFCDPKNDEWAPSVMFAAAKRMGKPYRYIDLNRPHGPQFNLFEGATEEEAFELLQAGFGLTDKGDASDYYGIEDREEAGNTAKIIACDGLTIAEAYASRMAAQDDSDKAKKFLGKLREMAQTPSINAKSGGVNLAQVVAAGGCVYIVGSMRNDIVKTAQRILLVRLIQLAERRDRMAGELRKVCIILDEVKYHLSKPAQEALGAARDKGVHLVIAHQSLGDLKDCTKDMNPDAVVDAIVENCKVKICYQVQSPDTAQWLARMSGTILVDDESRTVTKNVMQTETVENVRTIRQTERYFIDENMLLKLEPSVAVLYGVGLPRFVSIRPLKVPKSPDAVRIVECRGGVVESAVDRLTNLERVD